MSTENQRVAKVCGHCGSKNVTKDALACWDEDGQRWELQTVLQNEDCDDCEGETNLKEVELPDQRRDDNQPAMAYCVIQEGGTSEELYMHAYDTLKDANRFRKSAWRKGSYLTSVPVEVPTDLLDHPKFFETVNALLVAAQELDAPCS